MGRFGLLVLALLFSASPCLALVGGGGYVPFAGKMQTDKQGEDNKTTFSPYVVFHHPFRISARHAFKPHAGLVVNGQTNEDYNKKTLFLLYHLSFAWTSWMAVNYGLGTFWTRVEGEGGTVDLANGAGTATFYRPSEKVISYNTTLDLGLEFFLQKTTSLAVDGYLFSFLSSEKRSVSYSVSLNYYL